MVGLGGFEDLDWLCCALILQLQARNEEGSSQWSDVVKYRTLPDKPRPPPRPQVKGKVHSHSFRVVWGKFYMHGCTLEYMHTCAHTQTHTDTHTCTQTHAHKHMHTQTCTSEMVVG